MPSGRHGLAGPFYAVNLAADIVTPAKSVITAAIRHRSPRLIPPEAVPCGSW
jgi:hypothetical protein